MNYAHHTEPNLTGEKFQSSQQLEQYDPSDMLKADLPGQKGKFSSL
jgi:hypothetical protein